MNLKTKRRPLLIPKGEQESPSNDLQQAPPESENQGQTPEKKSSLKSRVKSDKSPSSQQSASEDGDMDVSESVESSENKAFSNSSSSVDSNDEKQFARDNFNVENQDVQKRARFYKFKRHLTKLSLSQKKKKPQSTLKSPTIETQPSMQQQSLAKQASIGKSKSPVASAPSLPVPVPQRRNTIQEPKNEIPFGSLSQALGQQSQRQQALELKSSEDQQEGKDGAQVMQDLLKRKSVWQRILTKRGGVPGQKEEILSSDFQEALSQQNPILHKLISEHSKIDSSIATIWSYLRLFVHTYTFFTVFYFLGLPGFPEGVWLVFEGLSEIFLIADFFLVIVLLKCFPRIWETVWLLHQKNDRSKILLLLRLIGSFPISITLNIVLFSNQEALMSLSYAFLRGIKILRLTEVSQFFEVLDIQKRRSKKASFWQAFVVVYYFFLATHFIGCVWLITARLDPNQTNWFVMAKYYSSEKKPTTFQIYIDSVYFVVATMTGLGYGNIYPSTNLEWFVCNLIMIAGSSIYANFFANFTVAIYLSNRRQIENDKKFHQAKQFASIKNLSEDFLVKIRFFYNNLRLGFNEFSSKHKLLHELPVSLQEEISVIFNASLIQSVNFFQLAEPSFIVAITRHLEPQICISKEFVFMMDETAAKMYFIHQGFIEVLASDNVTTICFQGQGCYFGEIGLLLNEGKRTCSVRTMSTSILYYVNKTEFLKILENFPKQKKFLRAVGRQRLKTTHPQDLFSNSSEKAQHHLKIVSELHMQAAQCQNLLFKSNSKNLSLNQSRIKVKVDLPPLEAQENDGSSPGDSPASRDQSKKKSFKKKQRTRCWQTSTFNTQTEFMIIPFSRMYNIWTALLFGAIAFNLFIVLYTISLEVDFDSTAFFVVDAIVLLIYFLDIFVRSNTAITTPREYCLDRKKVQSFYFNKWLVPDLISMLPLYYILKAAHVNADWIRYIRLIRLIKIGRFFESCQVIRYHSNINMHVITLVQMFFAFIVFSHIMACCYIFIGRQEVFRSNRFDGQTLFGNVVDRNFLTLPPVMEMSNIDIYWTFYYFSSGTMGAVMYGDCIPFAMSEQLFTFIAMFVARIYLAFLFAEAANFLTSLHLSKQTHSAKVSTIKRWLHVNSFPEETIKRVTDFHNILWNDFQGIDESMILEDLPQSLRTEIRNKILGPLIANWQAFPKDNMGALATVIQKLELKLTPQNEFIIRCGEVAKEMFFIVNGRVKITSAEGVQFAQLKTGDNFGEMALLDTQKPIRGANVISIEQVSLAVLTLTDFNLICELYPSFHQNILEVVRLRNEANAAREKATLMQTIVEKVAREDKSAQSDSDSLYTDPNNQNSVSDVDSQNEEEKVPDMQSGEQLRFSQKSKSEINESARLQIYDDSAINASSLDGLNDETMSPKIDMESAENHDFKDTPVLSLFRDHSKTETPLLLMVQAEERTPPKPKKRLSKAQSSPSMKVNQVVPAPQKPLLDPKKRRSTIYVTGVRDHFVVDKEHASDEKKKVRWLTPKNFMTVMMLILSVYNILFIPLQFGFRIRFTGFFFAMEILTLIFYTADIILRIKKVRDLTKMNGSDGLKDFLTAEQISQMRQDKEFFSKYVLTQRKEIATAAIAVVPLSLIFSYTETYDPWYVLVVFQSLRLAKFSPISKGFNALQMQNLNMWRIIEVLVYYYLICNFLTNVIITMSAYQPDARETWLRRLPVPQASGMREDPNIWSDVSPGSLYIHALYFIVNTVSHVAVGEITMVTVKERIFNAFLILSGTFIYSFLFGNITAIVSSLAPSTQLEFHRKYNLVLNKLDNEILPVSLVEQVNYYFDWSWTVFRGINEKEFLAELPTSIKADILLSRYQEIVESSLLFRELGGDIHLAMANSLFQIIRIEVYMKDNFIFKLGSVHSSFAFILEGSVAVLGLQQDEYLGTLNAGSHYSTDLGVEPEQSQSKSVQTLLENQQPLTNLDELDNLDRKVPLHLVCRTVVVVGYIDPADLHVLYNAYPEWKCKIQTINRLLFNLGLKSLENFMIENEQTLTRKDLLSVMDNHFTFSNFKEYQKIVAKSRSPAVEVNLNNLIRQKYIEISPQNPEQKASLSQNLKRAASSHRAKLESNGITGFGLKLSINPNKNLRIFLDFLHLMNLLFIGFALPFCISFNLKIVGVWLVLEIISLFSSTIRIATELRTPIIVHGQTTLDFRKVLRNYWQNGLIYDIFGLLPLNLALGQIDLLEVSTSVAIVLTILRLVRIVSTGQIMSIFGKFEIVFKRFNFIMGAIKAALSLFFLGHLMSCALFYTVSFEKNVASTWATVNNLPNKSLPEKYLLSYYLVLNVVTSVGYGDMQPATDVERMFFVILMTSGDVLFALAFGLIASISMQQSTGDLTNSFIEKMVDTQHLLDEFNIVARQQQRVEDYFAFAFFKKNFSKFIDKEDLIQLLPEPLVKEIVFHSTKNSLGSMFNSFGSENLLKELSFVLQTIIYLPRDFIIEINQLGQEMFFLAEGSVFVIGADKQTVLTTLKKGSFFGEIAILFKSKRTSNVQAETMCVVNVLKKDDLDAVMKLFPKIERAIKLEAQKRLQHLKELKKTAKMQSCVQSFKEPSLNINREIEANSDFSDESLEESKMSKKARRNSQFPVSVDNTELVNQNTVKKHRSAAMAQLRNRLQTQVTPNKPTQLEKQNSLVKTVLEEHVSIRSTINQKPGMRRLSGMSLRKNLALGNSSGLKLQWTVGQ